MALVIFGAAGAIHGRGVTPTAPAAVTIVQSSELPTNGTSSPDRFTKKQPVAFSPAKSPSSTKTLSFAGPTAAAAAKPLLGFGGAITDSVAAVFAELTPTLQEEVLERIWGATGNRYTMARLTIGSTDFSTTVYNYNPPDDVPDYDQSQFTLEHDTDKILPLIRKAMLKVRTAASGAELRFISSTWSPPGWMKRPYLSRSGHMRNSAKPGMVDDPKIYKSYALYLSKYISAMAAAGVNITRMTIQNEPDSADHMFPVAYPACNFNGTGEGAFLRDYLGPQMIKDHPGVRIYIHDGQKFHDVPILNRVQAIVKSAGSQGLPYIHGVAFHWYGNNLKNYQFLEELHAAYPAFDLLATEATLEDPATQNIGSTPWKEAQKYAVDIIGDLNAGASGWIEWNVLLDHSGGPTCIGTTAGTDCVPLAGHCDAPILANPKKQSLEIRDTYYFMGAFSRFIPPGSIHLGLAQGSDGGDTNSTFMATAAKTPAGNTIAVVLNTDAKSEVAYQLEVGGSYAAITIPPHSIQTLTF